MRKLLVTLGILGMAPLATMATHAFGAMPDNPIAFGNCTAKVKVDAARLRSAPSLDGKVLGVRVQDDPLFVTKVYGKWVQVELTPGDTAYIAAYLLSFPANEILEQWKRETPSPSVGKKAKVKWAKVHLLKYPSARSPRLGHFGRHDAIAVLTDLGNGWSLVEGRKADGQGNCFGFVASRSLSVRGAADAAEAAEAPGAAEAPYLSGPAAGSAPLAQVRLDPGEKMEQDPVMETPAQYCQRTAWTPELFAMELRSQPRMDSDPQNPAPGPLLAVQ